MKSRVKTRESTSMIQAELQIERQGDIEFQNLLIEERDKEIQGLVTEMHDVNDLFKEMAVIVEEQGEKVNIVSDNIQASMVHVESAKKEIDEANEAMKRGCCVLF